jgi:hypothetical protein
MVASRFRGGLMPSRYLPAATVQKLLRRRARGPPAAAPCDNVERKEQAVEESMEGMGGERMGGERALMPGAALGAQVQVFVPRNVFYDLGALNKAMANVLGRLGCPNCHSGYDIRVRQALDFAVDPRSMEVREIFMGR